MYISLTVDYNRDVRKERNPAVVPMEIRFKRSSTSQIFEILRVYDTDTRYNRDIRRQGKRWFPRDCDPVPVNRSSSSLKSFIISQDSDRY